MTGYITILFRTLLNASDALRRLNVPTKVRRATEDRVLCLRGTEGNVLSEEVYGLSNQLCYQSAHCRTARSVSRNTYSKNMPTSHNSAGSRQEVNRRYTSKIMEQVLLPLELYSVLFFCDCGVGRCTKYAVCSNGYRYQHITNSMWP